MNDLLEANPKGSLEVRELKRLIGNCNGGNFNTPELRAVRKRHRIQEWGKDMQLGSWKLVLDTHGPNVAYEALRQGTLPYVPHILLLPGHGLKFPESHEFLMARQFWGERWKTEIEYPDDDPIETQHGIDEFLRKRE